MILIEHKTNSGGPQGHQTKLERNGTGMKTRTTHQTGNQEVQGWNWPKRLFGFLPMLLFLLTSQAALQAATVTTDQGDYAPFTVVTITGSGFQPGETINNQVTQIAGPAPGTAYAP